MSLEYLEIRGRYKPKMHDRESMKIVIDENETSKVASLMINSIIHLVISSGTNDAKRTMDILSSVKNYI